MNTFENLNFKTIYTLCKKDGMNLNIISMYGGFVITSFIGLAYTYIQQTTSPIDEGWLLVFERLGIPLVLLVALVISLGRFVTSITPFLMKQLERIVSVPLDQLELERKERQEQKKIIDKQQELLTDVALAVNRLADKLDVYIQLKRDDGDK